MRLFAQLLALISTALMALSPGAYAAAAASGGSASAAAATPTPKAARPSAAQGAANERMFYALGVLLSRNQNLAALDLSDQELKQVLAGFRDGYQHHAHIDDPESYLPQVQALQQSREQAVAEREKRAGAAFAARVAELPNAQKTASGLIYVPLQPGSGAKPGPMDRVKVQYTGKLIDGSVFDSSYKRGQPATFPLAGIIPCWKEALQLMKVGGKARVICPSDLAYGDRGRPPVIPPGATLDFQIELLDVLPPQAPGRTPGIAMPGSPPPPHSGAPGAGASGPR